jgi:hypothetical protein
MTFSDLGPIIGVLGFLLALSGFIRTEQVRRLAITADVWKKLEDAEKRLSIMELRLNPLFSVMDSRLAAMFHQPCAEAWYTDQLIERYGLDPERLTDDEIQALISHVDKWYERTKDSRQDRERFEALAASVFSAFLQARLAIRHLNGDS